MRLADLKLTLKNAGYRGLSYDLAYRVGHKLTSLVVLQGMTLTPATIDRSFLEGNPKYSHGFLDEPTLRAYAKQPGLELDDAFLDKVLPTGDRCYAIRDGATLAAYGWYSRNPTPINDDLMLHFDPRWVYMYKGFTAHSHRGQRLHGVGMAKAMAAYVAEGCLGIVSQVERNNFSSMKSVHRMGYVDNGRIRAWRALGRWHVRATKACAPFGLRLEPIAH